MANIVTVLRDQAAGKRPIRWTTLLHCTDEAMVWQWDRLVDGSMDTRYRVCRRLPGGWWANTDYESAEAAIAAVEPVGVGA